MGALDQSTNIDLVVNISRRRDPYAPLKSGGKRGRDLSYGIQALVYFYSSLRWVGS